MQRDRIKRRSISQVTKGCIEAIRRRGRPRTLCGARNRKKSNSENEKKSGYNINETTHTEYGQVEKSLSIKSKKLVFCGRNGNQANWWPQECIYFSTWQIQSMRIGKCHVTIH